MAKVLFLFELVAQFEDFYCPQCDFLLFLIHFQP